MVGVEVLPLAGHFLDRVLEPVGLAGQRSGVHGASRGAADHAEGVVLTPQRASVPNAVRRMRTNARSTPT